MDNSSLLSAVEPPTRLEKQETDTKDTDEDARKTGSCALLALDKRVLELIFFAFE